jgi:hypothetical protein
MVGVVSFAYYVGLWVLFLMVIGVFVHRSRPGEVGSEGGLVLAMVPAHNEELVIEATIESLRSSGCLVVVIADGCTDNTVELAREKGVFVYEVNELNKGRAINAYMEQAGELLASCVGVTCIDCGTVVERAYAARVRAALVKFPVVQGWLRSCGWHTWINAWSCWLYGAYHLSALGRDWLRLPAMIGGTGFAWRPGVFVRFDSRCMVEDLELGLRLHKAGVRVGYVDLGVYDEKPSSLRASLVQRTRWASGDWWLVMHGRGLTWRVDDFAVCFGIMSVLLFSAGTWLFVLRQPGAVVMGVSLYMLLGVVGLWKLRQLEKVSWTMVWSIPLMQCLEAFVNMKGLMTCNTKTWSHTRHGSTSGTNRA